MSDFLRARSEADSARREVGARLAQRNLPVDERTLLELQAIRKQLFWGPFWAIVATGAISAALWLLAVFLLT